MFDGNGIDREQRPSSYRATSPQVPETQGSFLTTVLSTTGCPKAVKPDDHRDVGCALALARNFAELHAEKRRLLANLAEFSKHWLQIEGAQVRNISISLWLAPADV